MNRKYTSTHPPDDRDRIIGCWLGKAVGGTLGTPLEGEDGPFDLTFYDPPPTTMLPNDDLDLQVVWAVTMDNLEMPRVDRQVLADAWLRHNEFPFSEYAVAMRNLRLGIRPPLSGAYDNWFKNNMGAAIRSELWACLAPGNPELAAAYAYEDACVDHADDGLAACLFLTALQSAAFTNSDPQALLDSALAYVPDGSAVKHAVQDTRQWWAAGDEWLAVRNKVLDRYGVDDSSHVVMNIAFTVLGWLAGDGDFGKSICTAVNCGRDTDCTAATVGALMGIIDPACITAEWLDPIGHDLVLSPQIRDLEAPATINAFSDLVIDLRRRLDGALPTPEIVEQSADPFRIRVDAAFTDWTTIEGIDDDVGGLLANAAELVLPGALASMDRDEFRDAVLLLRYGIRIGEAQRIRLVFNTPQRSCVWVDGVRRFSRQGGLMIPSPHRAPDDQYADLDLDAGRHELIAAVGRPDGAKADWVIAVAETTGYQWIPDTFDFVGA